MEKLSLKHLRLLQYFCARNRVTENLHFLQARMFQIDEVFRSLHRQRLLLRVQLLSERSGRQKRR